jgi:hypothetical protein
VKVMVGNVPVELEIDEDEMILDVVILTRTVSADAPHGATAGTFAASAGLDRITQVGMLYTALKSTTKYINEQ